MEEAVDEVRGVLVPAIAVPKRDWDTTVDGPPPNWPSHSRFIHVLYLKRHNHWHLHHRNLSLVYPLHFQRPFLFMAHTSSTALAMIIALLTDPSCSGYITHLLDRTILFTKEVPNYQARRKLMHKHWHQLIFFSLSHNPPKTSFQTLSPLFSLGVLISNIEVVDIMLSMTISVGLFRFTPPKGKPWIKCIPPIELEGIVMGLIPETNIWVVPDADADAKNRRRKKWVRWRKRSSWGGLQEKGEKKRGGRSWAIEIGRFFF